MGTTLNINGRERFCLIVTFPGVVCGFLLALTYGWFFEDIFQPSGMLQGSALFYAIFELFAVLTGFMFSAFLFVATASNEFIRRARRTWTFQATIELLKLTVFLGFIVTTGSFAIGVLELPPQQTFGLVHVVTTVIVFLAGVWLINAARCLGLFAALAREDGK